jgi:hypothetical protein
MSNQYAREKNVKDVIDDLKNQLYIFEESIGNSSIHESEDNVDYAYWTLIHNAHVTLTISNSLITILVVGADTCVFFLFIT